MKKRLSGLLPVLLCIAAVSAGPAALTVFARGDRVVPQVADGSSVIRTKLDITNLSPAVRITKVKVYFYTKSGAAWQVATNLGTSNEFLIELGRSQVVRIETLGVSPGIVSGYAVIRNMEGNAAESLDYQLSVSVFYEVLNGPKVTDTVAVSVGPPTLRWNFPVEIDSTRAVYSGFALVNLAAEPNPVTLQLWSSFSPSSADATDTGRLTLTLAAGEQRAQFLNEPGLFSQVVAFRGALVGEAAKPVAVVALLQTQTPNGVQYATLAPAFLDSQRTETYVLLPERSHLDADVPTVPFLNTDDSRSFDVYYETVSDTVHNLVAENGAQLAGIGVRTFTEYQTLAADDLRALTYRQTPIGIADITGNFVAGYTFAVQTSLGRLAKVRIVQIVESGFRRDLALQVYVYR